VDPMAAMDTVKERNIFYLYRKSNNDFRSIACPVLFNFLFPCSSLSKYQTLGTANINAHFQGAGLPGYSCFAMEPSNFTVSTFMINGI
jgi:phosphoglycerol transferase MdoB-like AlkP superfamily enzyme